MTTTSTLPTLSRAPSTPPSPAPSAAIDNLAKVPGGLWALIFFVASAVLGCGVWICVLYFKKKEGEKLKKTQEIPSGGWIPAVATPQTALTTNWLWERFAGNTSRPLPVLLHSLGPDVAQPDADNLTAGDIQFVIVPSGHEIFSPPSTPIAPLTPPHASPAASPNSKWRDPTVINTSTRTVGHGFKGLSDYSNPVVRVAQDC
ncbi:hypothetical protein N7523_010716 [Penicillium sp. IBT 18751x]|nr:hypothetical protein N7523_010716 [Penicillium sp. IBT 18751x]